LDEASKTPLAYPYFHQRQNAAERMPSPIVYG
jgi:hypothetical protein